MRVFRSCLMTRWEYDFPDYATIEKGKYGPQYYFLKINGIALSYRHLANFCSFLAHNEERRFPQRDGFFGKNKLIDCLLDAMEDEQVSRDLLEKHKI